MVELQILPQTESKERTKTQCWEEYVRSRDNDFEPGIIFRDVTSISDAAIMAQVPGGGTA